MTEVQPERGLSFSQRSGIYLKFGIAAAAGVVLNERLKHDKAHPVIDKIGSVVVGHLASLNDRDPSVEFSELEELYEVTNYWHGTGRYQYGANGQPFDVLQAIVDKSGLVPGNDNFDFLIGPMKTVSLASSRMYARAYADMHGRGKNENGRFGSSAFWAGYFLASMVPYTIQETRYWSRAGRAEVHRRLTENPVPNWSAKLNSKIKGIYTPFIYGSDIAGNYPILIGVGLNQIRPAAISKTVALHEIRTVENISLAGLTHLEVPRQHLEETRKILAPIDLPVVAIEDMEKYCANIPFSQHIRPASVA